MPPSLPALQRAVRHANAHARQHMHFSSTRWYVLLVRSGKEMLSQQILHRRHFPAYLPLQPSWHRINRYKRVRRPYSRPLVPGFLLLGIPSSSEDFWGEIFNATVSAYAVLGTDGIPSPLTGPQLSQFIASLPRTSSSHSFSPGQRLPVLNGPFSGTTLQLSQLNHRHAFVLFQLFGHTRFAQISIDKLRTMT